MRRRRALVVIAVLTIALLAALRLPRFKNNAASPAVAAHARIEETPSRLALRRAIELAVVGRDESAALVRSAMDDAVRLFLRATANATADDSMLPEPPPSHASGGIPPAPPPASSTLVFSSHVFGQRDQYSAFFRNPINHRAVKHTGRFHPDINSAPMA